MVELCTSPPTGATVVCTDELGPVIPRTFPPTPGWSPDVHRIKNEIDYSRGPAKNLGLRRLTRFARARNSR